MAGIDHKKRSHALLSASGAERWLNCTPSAKLEEEFGEKSDSSYAAEGTVAHELAELYLRKDTFGKLTDAQFDNELEKIMSNELFNPEMLDMVPMYTDYCETQYKAAKEYDPAALIEIEKKLDLTEFIPSGFGTADCVVLDKSVLEVIDLKYGKGVPVYADWNKQLMLYGLGALLAFDTLYDIEQVRLTIVQPRLNNISSFLISVDELRNWGENTVKPLANKANVGEGELAAGDWCRWCAVKNRCRKLYDEQIKLAKYEFKEPELLTDQEISDILTRAPKFTEWLNAITTYAQTKAVCENKQWPGFKLVEGRSVRKWENEEEAINAIYAKCPELGEEDIFEMKLKPLTALEKLIGKKRFDTLFAENIVKPQGKPTLVPVEDKRPAMGIIQAQLDFGEDLS